jgi:hypothetical protein
MDTNLDPDYVRFIQSGGSLGHVAQELIDRMQYTPGFLAKMQLTIETSESPFEEHPGIRKLKPHYLKSKT